MPNPTLDGQPIQAVLRNKRTQLLLKRMFDVAASAAGLLVLSPIFLLVGIAIKLDSPGPVFFRQIRMGKEARPFTILKFRTMVHDPRGRGLKITVGEDARITKAGEFLRKSKVDELPQLLNVLKGDMSLVGPRPEVSEYLKYYSTEDLSTLWIRPGITGPASVYFRDESEILAESPDPDQTYIKEIIPKKNELNKQYIRDLSVGKDIRMIFATFRAI